MDRWLGHNETLVARSAERGIFVLGCCCCCGGVEHDLGFFGVGVEELRDLLGGLLGGLLGLMGVMVETVALWLCECGTLCIRL